MSEKQLILNRLKKPHSINDLQNFYYKKTVDQQPRKLSDTK